MPDSAPFPYLNAESIARRLSMADAITAMRAAFADQVENPPRVLLGNSLFMPARVGGYTGVKVVCIKPGNPVGTVTVYDPDGSPMGMLDGAALTTLRTGAASGLATELLARSDASSLAMLGTGAVSVHQVEAICCVRPIRALAIWSRRPDRAQALAEAIAQSHPHIETRIFNDANAAVSAADVVNCATPARQPIFDVQAVQPGTHINAVGAFAPDMAEVPKALLHQARVFVESRTAAAREAGDLLRAQRTPDGEIRDLLARRTQGREHRDQITVFKSVGVASQDVAAAVVALLGTKAFATRTNMPPRATLEPASATCSS